MAFMLASLEVPLTWGEILKRTFREAFLEDNCLAMAAQLAYYFLFALFPSLLFVIALASYFPLHTLIDDIMRALGGFAPPEVLTIITDQLRKISHDRQGGLLTLGVVVALWTSSGAMTAIIDTLNRAYDIPESRPWWKVRLTAIALTVGVSLFILVSFALVTVGPTFAERAAEWFGLGAAFEWTWKVLQWPVVFALVSVAIAAIYYWGPDADQDWVWLTPGAIFATLAWIVGSLAFKYYVASMSNYTETYGAIGGFMVLMLWFYISGLVILLGAEMNAEIEHASPYGKDEGEKVPGERRKIGPARMRAWRQRQRDRAGRPAAAPGMPEPLPARAPGTPEALPAPALAMTDTRRQLPPARRFSDWAIGLGVVFAQLYWAARSLRARGRARS